MTQTPAFYLVDTNILLRLSENSGAHHFAARRAIDDIHRAGDVVFLTAQNLIEFWSVATRPRDRNGLGMTTAEAIAEIARHQAVFRFLPDAPAVFEMWETLVQKHGVAGAQSHDARLAAVALAYQVPNFLTFNSRHFARFIPDGLTPIEPHEKE